MWYRSVVGLERLRSRQGPMPRSPCQGAQYDARALVMAYTSLERAKRISGMKNDPFPGISGILPEGLGIFLSDNS